MWLATLALLLPEVLLIFRPMARLVARKVGELESAVAELREREAQLVAARERAESATRAKSQFLSQMSHELRTPMTAIIGTLDLLSSGQASPDQREMIGVTRRSAGHMMEMLNDLLDLSKIEADRLELSVEPVALSAVLGDLESLYAESLRSKGLRLRVSCAAEVPDLLLLDGSRLRQILGNLLGNATKFTARGSVELRVEAVPAGAGGKRLRFAVRDSGIGIAPDRHEAVFGLFEQAGAETARTFRGTGLGLAISRKLARLMGGDISLVSQEGLGSCFTLDLPLVVAEVAAAAPRRALETTEKLLGARPWPASGSCRPRTSR